VYGCVSSTKYRMNHNIRMVNMARFKHMETAVENWDFTLEETKSRLNLENA
jgi:hypothetical protein